MPSEIVDYLAERAASNPTMFASSALTLGLGAVAGATYALDQGLKIYEEKFRSSPDASAEELNPSVLEQSEDPETDYLE